MPKETCGGSGKPQGICAPPGRASLFVCPHCGQTLFSDEKRLVCPRGHSFDLSSAGYVNLLPPSRGRHGDNKEMIAARRRFLDGGYYLPLREAVCGALVPFAPRRLLDVGCGEGYYTEGMANALPDCRVAGLDVSKDALALAGRRLRGRAELAAGSAYRLPAADGAFDALTLIFSPFSREECLRVLVPGGVFVMAAPGRRHLFELKELLYDAPYENAVAEPALEGFEYLGERVVNYSKRVEGDALRDLFAMTPYYYRTPAIGREKAASCPGLGLTLSFHVFLYSKNE